MMQSAASPHLALCADTSETASGIGLALASEGKAPEWIQLMPAGPVIKGRDGREWKLNDPSTLIYAFKENEGPLAIDYEHAQDIAAPQGMPAPASGWIEALELRQGGEVWGKVTWTQSAATAICAKEYRFISPAFTYSTKTGDVIAIKGASLVNRPNFVMPALNREGSKPMFKGLLKKLGLAETASEADAIAALDKLNADHQVALNSVQTQPSDVAKFVPRADYEVALNRATTAEGKLAAQETAAKDAEITRLIDEAVAAGKIAPVSKDYHTAMCRQGTGLDEFKKMIAAAPSVFKPSGLANKDPDADTKTALNAEQVEVLAKMGISTEDALKHNKAI